MSGGITVCVVVSVTVKLDVTKTCRIGLAGKIVVVVVAATVDCTEIVLVTVTSLVIVRFIVLIHSNRGQDLRWADHRRRKV